AVALTAPPIGTGNPRRAYLPTGQTEAAYRDARNDRMKGAHADGLMLIDGLEPWAGGKAKLRELHDLDILDKHLLLVPSIASMRITNLEVKAGDRVLRLTQ